MEHDILLKNEWIHKNEDEGIELDIDMEMSDDESGVEYPYRSEDIRIEQKMLSLYQLCRWIEQGTLIIRPEFQRNLVWDIRRKSLLIESLMLKIPIPAFYLDENEEGIKTVIDGMQRLSTIHEFITGKFKLKELQYLTHCEKKTFAELDKKYQLRIEDTQLAVNILDAKCPKMVKFDVFRRINTGGIPLNHQEVRNIMATNETRELLLKMSECAEFKRATHDRVNDRRMGAQELCLRYITYLKLYSYNNNKFIDFGNMTRLFDEMILKLNDMSLKEQDIIYDSFVTSMKKCYALFGERAFCKPDIKLINRALFTSFSIIMSYEPKTEQALEQYRNEMNVALAYLLKEDKNYSDAITSSTSSKRNMEIQFKYARELMEGICV